MFNQAVSKHNDAQLLNPFAQVDGRASPKPKFSKEEYGKYVLFVERDLKEPIG